jgi:hypothetical protein
MAHSIQARAVTAHRLNGLNTADKRVSHIAGTHASAARGPDRPGAWFESPALTAGGAAALAQSPTTTRRLLRPRTIGFTWPPARGA